MIAEAGYTFWQSALAWLTFGLAVTLVASVVLDVKRWLAKLIGNRQTTPESVKVTIEQMYAEKVDVHAAPSPSKPPTIQG